MNIPFISVIIPARNAQRTIKKCIDSVLNLNYPSFELIVVNDGSSDDTTKILAGYPQVKILDTPGVGPSQARNMALKQAQGEFVAFTDADCIVDSNWLRELLRGFEDERVVGVGGIQRSPQDESIFAKQVHDFLSIFGFVAEYMQSANNICKTKHNPSCNVMYRASVLRELGGFREDLWPGEDVELDYRINKKGYLLKFNPEAVVYHYRPANLGDFSKMMFRYGKAQGRLVRRYGFFRGLHLVPVIICVLFLISYLNVYCSLILFLCIFSAVIIRLILKSRKVIPIFILFLSSVICWNIGFVKGLFSKIK